jgi:4-amino-4-deoxy-L-arabinose transferase-like glycosyltransferase
VGRPTSIATPPARSGDPDRTAHRTAGRGTRARLRAIPLPILLLGALILVRLAIAAWWLAVDHSVFDTESSRHLQRAWDGYSAMQAGDAFALFKSPTEYPPLLYLVGSLGAWVGGKGIDSFVGAQDLFFVPALAIGCYGAATIAYGRLAGILAAVFALGAPMAISVFHMFLIDTTEAAMVAVALWAILATDRFSRPGMSALAGAAVGFGMLGKQNFPVFVVGLLAVVLLRGGWRHWRGLLLFAAVAVLISASWYWSELSRTLDLIRGASAPGLATAGTPTPTADRWTGKNLGYYAWSLFNVSVLVPLMLAAAGGAVALLVRWAKRRSRDDHTPELVAGALFAYAALTWISLKDPRYALPMLPYLAVLGAGWIPLLRGRRRLAAVTAIPAIAVLNLVMTIWVTGPPGDVYVKGAPGNSFGRQLTFWLPQGWIAGQPERSDAVEATLRAAHRSGIGAIAFDAGATQSNFNQPGLDIVSRMAGMPLALTYDPSDRRQAMLANHYPPLPGHPPCGVLSDGTGIYLSRGPVDGVPFEQRDFFCPPRSAYR